MRLKQHSMEVLRADETIVRLGQTEIAALQAALAQSSRGRSRICAHRDSSDSLHEMLIVLSRASYIRPHKHFGKSESFHIVQLMKLYGYSRHFRGQLTRCEIVFVNSIAS